MMDYYFTEKQFNHVDDALRYMLMNNKGCFKNVIYPVMIEKPKWLRRIISFIYHKTKWKFLIVGYECNGKRYKRMEDIVFEKPKAVVFKRYTELPMIEEEEHENSEGQGNTVAAGASESGSVVPSEETVPGIEV